MKKEEDVMQVERRLPEITVTQYGKYWDEESLKEYYFSIPGEVYDRNPALFRMAIRFMQKNRDLKGESRIFNKCVNAGTNRVAREYVLPVLLGVAAFPVILEAGPIVKATISFLKAVYTNPATWLRMGANWSAQAMAEGKNEVDYVSVVAEGFTVGGSAVSALIEIRPATEKGLVFRKGFIDKSFTDTSVDIVIRGLGAGFTKYYVGMASELVDHTWSKALIGGFGTLAYTQYQLATLSVSEIAKGAIKKEDEK